MVFRRPDVGCWSIAVWAIGPKGEVMHKETFHYDDELDIHWTTAAKAMTAADLMLEDIIKELKEKL